jgi:hypothetical protein
MTPGQCSICGSPQIVSRGIVHPQDERILRAVEVLTGKSVIAYQCCRRHDGEQVEALLVQLAELRTKDAS